MQDSSWQWASARIIRPTSHSPASPTIYGYVRTENLSFSYLNRIPFLSFLLMLCCKTRHLAGPTNLTTVYGESHTVWNTMGTESKAKNMLSHLFTLQWFFFFLCCSGNKGLMCWTVFLKPLIHSLAKISRATLTPFPPQLSELKPRLPGKTRLLAKTVTSWNEAQPIIVPISISQIQQKIVRSQETHEAIGHVGAAYFPLNKEQENVCITSGLI